MSLHLLTMGQLKLLHRIMVYVTLVQALITTLITNTGSITTATRYGLSTGSSATITTIENSGTISAGAHSGLRNYKGVIGTITNSGTISAVNNYGLTNKAHRTIGTITNTGTISAGDTDNDSDYGLDNGGTIGTITNSGTISAVDKWGLYNNGTIEKITNSGTISAGDTDNDSDYGFFNSGTIETITNSGTISATNRYGLYNSRDYNQSLSNLTTYWHQSQQELIMLLLILEVLSTLTNTGSL